MGMQLQVDGYSITPLTCHAGLVSAFPAAIWAFEEVDGFICFAEKCSKAHTSIL